MQVGKHELLGGTGGLHLGGVRSRGEGARGGKGLSGWEDSLEGMFKTSLMKGAKLLFLNPYTMLNTLGLFGRWI